MPQLVNVVLKDNADVDHTFVPNNITGGVATLVESTGVPIGDKRVSIASVTTQQGRRKMTFKVAVPVMQDAVVNGVTRPTVVRTAYADITLTFDGSSSSAERRTMLAFIETLMSNSMIDAVVGDLQGLY